MNFLDIGLKYKKFRPITLRILINFINIILYYDLRTYYTAIFTLLFHRNNIALSYNHGVDLNYTLFAHGVFIGRCHDNNIIIMKVVCKVFFQLLMPLFDCLKRVLRLSVIKINCVSRVFWCSCNIFSINWRSAKQHGICPPLALWLLWYNNIQCVIR